MCHISAVSELSKTSDATSDSAHSPVINHAEIGFRFPFWVRFYVGALRIAGGVALRPASVTSL